MRARTGALAVLVAPSLSLPTSVVFELDGTSAVVASELAALVLVVPVSDRAEVREVLGAKACARGEEGRNRRRKTGRPEIFCYGGA